MSHDVISDALNKIMNAKRARKESIVITKFSKVLLKVLEIAKEKDYIENVKEEKKNLTITFNENLHFTGAIKPRHNVTVSKIEVFMKRFLPAKNMGIMIISTSKGLMTHDEAIDKKLGGSLIAYFY